MKLVALSNPIGCPLPYYLAVEEWVARRLPEGDYLFAWQVDKSVICGRHQAMELEVDMPYCRDNEIEVWRRKSGGGCVYADRNNLMFSYITSRRGNQGCFEHYTAAMCKMLAGIGIEAAPSGRNDIEVGGRKLAGNAFYGLKGRSIVHGTMLYDADLETMGQALTPSRAKLCAKGVKSVPKRVTTLREQGVSLTIDEFRNYALRTVCDEGEVAISAEGEREIAEIMKTYLDPDFRYDKQTGGGGQAVRVEGCGELQFGYRLDADNRIVEPSLSGDFFATEEIRALIDCLDGCVYEREALCGALRRADVSTIISGLSSRALIDIILQTKPKSL